MQMQGRACHVKSVTNSAKKVLRQGTGTLIWIAVVLVP